MIFYDHTYYIAQEIEQVFDYFLHKNYLTTIFKEANTEIALHTLDDDPRIKEGEPMELIIGDESSISSFKVEVVEIVPRQLIDLSINVIEFVDKGESSVQEDEEAIDFLKKHLGLDMFFRLEFFEEMGTVKVIESGELKSSDLAWYARGFWKILGWYYLFKHRDIHKRIQEEIENSW